MIIPRRNISQVLHGQSTNGDACCKRQLPSYWNRTSHKQASQCKPSFVHAFTASSFLDFPRATQEEGKCHELSEMKVYPLLGILWITTGSLLHSVCRYCLLIWQGSRVVQDLTPPAPSPASLVALWLPLQSQHLGTAALLAQSVRALQRKLKESSPMIFGNSILPIQIWKVVLSSAHKLHPGLLSCGALEQEGFSQLKTTAFGWGLKSLVSKKKVKPAETVQVPDCIKPSDNQSLFLCFKKEVVTTLRGCFLFFLFFHLIAETMFQNHKTSSQCYTLACKWIRSPYHIEHVAGWWIHSRSESVMGCHTFLNKLQISNIRQSRSFVGVRGMTEMQ